MSNTRRWSSSSDTALKALLGHGMCVSSPVSLSLYFPCDVKHKHAIGHVEAKKGSQHRAGAAAIVPAFCVPPSRVNWPRLSQSQAQPCSSRVCRAIASLVRRWHKHGLSLSWTERADLAYIIAASDCLLPMHRISRSCTVSKLISHHV